MKVAIKIQPDGWDEENFLELSVKEAKELYEKLGEVLNKNEEKEEVAQ